ncbi:MAG: hypothetical protein ACK5L6_05115, partial [Anaerorhabdus sp.]|uniref:hypothetical protein n=1 Tax=Anaerorhabdus sp. TaxID=1872524 RepID=UPI003A886514
KGYSARDMDLIQSVQGEDDRVDAFNRSINDYLSQLREGMTADEARWQFVLQTFVNDLESAGDVVDRSLCDMLRKQTALAVFLPEADYRALRDLHERVSARLNIAIGFLASRGVGDVEGFLNGKETLNMWCRELQSRHYERLYKAAASDLAASAFFLDLLNGLRLFNSHITAIGYAIAKPRSKRLKG